MFNLEHSIAEWRKQMRAAGISAPVPLDELEIHLREDIEQQMKSGRGEPDAFHAAVQKIGRAQAVQTEFAKVGAINPARGWKLKETLVLVFSILMPLVIGRALLFRAWFLDMTFGEEISGLVAAATFSLLIWGGRLGWGMFPVIRAKRGRDAIINSCGLLVALWWMVFLCVIMPRHDFTMARFLVTFLWAFFTPAGIWLGIVLGLETAARKKNALADS